MSIVELLDFMNHLTLSEHQQRIGQQILKEIRSRLGFLVNVGLDYLMLARSTGTCPAARLSESVWRLRSAPDW